MKASTRFMKMFYKLPAEARRSLVWCDWERNGEPYSLNVCAIEVLGKTKLGERMLMGMGFEDD